MKHERNFKPFKLEINIDTLDEALALFHHLNVPNDPIVKFYLEGSEPKGFNYVRFPNDWCTGKFWTTLSQELKRQGFYEELDSLKKIYGSYEEEIINDFRGNNDLVKNINDGLSCNSVNFIKES